MHQYARKCLCFDMDGCSRLPTLLAVFSNAFFLPQGLAWNKRFTTRNEYAASNLTHGKPVRSTSGSVVWCLPRHAGAAAAGPDGSAARAFPDDPESLLEGIGKRLLAGSQLPAHGELVAAKSWRGPSHPANLATLRAGAKDGAR